LKIENGKICCGFYLEYKSQRNRKYR